MGFRGLGLGAWEEGEGLGSSRGLELVSQGPGAMGLGPRGLGGFGFWGKEAKGLLKLAPKLAPGWPQVGPGWRQNGFKLPPSWLQVAPSWHKLTQVGTSCPTLAPAGPKKGPRWAQVGPKLGPC